MEVHHHTHTARKKFLHYFWEFLMLFLAVFCGFLAEYQLEHKIEKDREKQFIQSMMEDLKSDSVILVKNIEDRHSRVVMIDSLFLMLTTPLLKDKMNELYFYARSLSPPINIFPNDRTIQQLKSSGNLRLIRKQNVSNGIMAYDQKVRSVLFSMGDEVELRAEYRILARKIFDSRVFYTQVGKDGSFSKPENNPALFNNEAAYINEFIGTLASFKRIHLSQSGRTSDLLKQSISLMELIKKEYHLK